MSSDKLHLSIGQVKFLMSKFDIDDPNKAIDFFIEIMLLEDINPMDMKLYILKMMEKDLEDELSKK